MIMLEGCDLCGMFVFFFKQKTAYEMRISDWSSDVCSSDLDRRTARRGGDDDDPLPRRQASRRHGLSRYTAGDRMMRAPRRIVGTLLALLGILVAAPAAEDRKSTRLNSSH